LYSVREIRFVSTGAWRSGCEAVIRSEGLGIGSQLWACNGWTAEWLDLGSSAVENSPQLGTHKSWARASWHRHHFFTFTPHFFAFTINKPPSLPF